MPEDYCDLCELPRSTCVHGRPPPPPPPTPVRTPRASGVRTSRTPGTPAPTAAPASRRPSRVTAVEDFRGHIMGVLADAEGPLETDELMAALALRLEDVLLERDRQVAPGGELRWQTSVRKARKGLIDEGVILAARPGRSELTERVAPA